MWELGVPSWWHLVVRAVIVYFFLVGLLRLTGRRQVGQLAPFDLVLLLVLSNAVQNSMIGGDSSITGGLISAASLVAINFIVGELVHRSKKIEALIEGRPLIIIHDGHVDKKALKRSQMTTHELYASLRQEGVADPLEVRFAILETNGKITVIPKKT